MPAPSPKSSASAHIARNMAEPDFAELPVAEQNRITRQAVACETLVIYRTMADPALTDLTIHPNQRGIIGLMQPDPQVANWSIPASSR